MADLCGICGLNLSLVGRRHRCAPLVANRPELVANTPTVVANKQSKHGQYADREKRRAYMRVYMAKRRGRPVPSQ